MKIGIIGYGVVGKAIESTLSNSYTIIKYDKYSPHSPFGDLFSCDFIFISVPTPFDSQKMIVDESAITENLEKLEQGEYSNTVIIKSTVPPGTCESYCDRYKLSLVFNPEFLRQSGNPNRDFAIQKSVVVGTPDKKCFERVRSMYRKVLSDDTTYYNLKLTEAEMVKYAQNTTLASRVALANIIYDACLQFDLDYSTIRKIAFDSFDIIGPYMVEVPGPDGKRGFGGACLPKDLMGFKSVHESAVLSEIIKYNFSLRDNLDEQTDK